jgi:uncharacterized protein
MPRLQHHPLLLFGLFAYGFSWLVWLVGISQLTGDISMANPRMSFYLLVGSFGPTLAAFVWTAVLDGRKGILELLRRLVKARAAWWLYILIFFLLPTLAFVLNLLVGIEPNLELWKIALTMILVSPLNSLMGGVIFGVGPLGEEVGWRGFVLPRLLTRHTSLQASVLLGLLWAFWHTPLFFLSDFRNGVPLWVFCLLYPLSLIFISYLMTRFHHWSKGSLLVAIWFHGAVNVTASQMSDPDLWNTSRFSPLILGLITLAMFGLAALVVGFLARRLATSEPLPSVASP